MYNLVLWKIRQLPAYVGGRKVQAAESKGVPIKPGTGNR